MNTDQGLGKKQSNLLHGELTDKIIGVFYSVYNELGNGFLESVYKNAMLLALAEAGLNAEAERATPVMFRGQNVGNFFADILVEKRVILELKTANNINAAHESQLLNYLRATDIEVGLILNFGTKAQFKRLRMDNRLKTIRGNPCESVVKG